MTRIGRPIISQRAIVLPQASATAPSTQKQTPLEPERELFLQPPAESSPPITGRHSFYPAMKLGQCHHTHEYTIFVYLSQPSRDARIRSRLRPLRDDVGVVKSARHRRNRSGIGRATTLAFAEQGTNVINSGRHGVVRTRDRPVPKQGRRLRSFLSICRQLP
jgi:hypothetical protein